MMSSEYCLHITPDAHAIKLETIQDGVHTCKNISFDAMMDSIKDSLERDAVSSGLLPEGCLSFQMGDIGRYTIALLHPEHRATLTYEGTEYQNFPLPRLVFKFEHQDGQRVRRCWMGVVGEGKLTPKTPMYHYPFSNVSAESFHLCVGNNVMPVCKSLYTLSSLPYLLIDAPNNNDRFNRNCNKPKLEMRDLMELLKDKDPDYYYSNILIPSRKTLQDFIDAQ